MLSEVKQGARKIWASGDYLAIARQLPPAAAQVVRAARIGPGDHVLDVACGTGITAISAARLGAKVDGLDLTPDLLAIAADEDARAGTAVAWKEGDAEDLPYPDATFDVVVSSFGHMFTPDPAAAIASMLRVLKPGGRIAFATWPPGSVVGGMLKAVSAAVPAPRGASSPLHWGTQETVADLLGDAVEQTTFQRGTIAWPTLSAGHMWHLFSSTYGPFIAVLGRLADQPEQRAAFEASVRDVFDGHLQDNVIPFEYLVTSAVKS